MNHKLSFVLFGLIILFGGLALNLLGTKWEQHQVLAFIGAAAIITATCPFIGNDGNRPL